MKLLCFQATRFWWKPYSRTLPEVAAVDVEAEVHEAVIVFFHAERDDEGAARRPRVLRQTLKHVKWLANKRSTRQIVFHSFTHLGGESATPAFAQELIAELSARLTATGYTVQTTPFGYFCEWDLRVHGDSLAKVWKEIGAPASAPASGADRDVDPAEAEPGSRGDRPTPQE